MEDFAIIGIDPGVTGAVALYEVGRDYRNMRAVDMPHNVVKKGKKNRKEVDEYAIGRLFELWMHQYQEVTIWLEHVHAQPFNGSIASFSLGRSFGIVQGAAAAFDIPCELVSPQRWKCHYDLLKADKRKSVEIANKLFPELDLIRAKDHNLAEAALIAAYGLYAKGKTFRD